jgi:uncharacterized protein (TIGR03437 family)
VIVPGVQRWITAFLLSLPALAQPRAITTVAGADWLFPGDGRPAVNAPLGGGFGMDIATDREGNLYIADMDNNMVMRVGPDGIVTVVAGNGVNFKSGEGGLAVNAALLAPLSIAVDRDGNLYIADIGDTIRRVTRDGIIRTIAGTGERGFGGDNGPALMAQFSDPQGLAFGPDGSLYVSDTRNHRIRRISPGGIITTVAGTGRPGFGPDNVPATQSDINSPTRIAVDPAGNIYFIVFPSDGKFGVRKVDTRGIITTVAGQGTEFGSNLPATQVALLASAVAVDGAGNLYIVDNVRQGVVRVDSAGILRDFAGGSFERGFAGDGGPALAARFRFIFAPALSVDPLGNVYVVDEGNRRVRRVTPQGRIDTVAGNGLFRFSGDGGPAVSATLDHPIGVAVDASGAMFIAEGLGHRIRRVAPDGRISVFAGTGRQGDAGDGGPATQAELSFPTHIAIGPGGDLYFSDAVNCAVRTINSRGMISTYVGGDCTAPVIDGGPKERTSLNLPQALVFDDDGTLAIADSSNHRIRVVLPPPDGRIFTLIGDGTPGFAGDGGPVSGVRINTPVGLALFGDGLYFSDQGNHRVRRMLLNAPFTVTTVAGNGQAGFAGDGGPATQASLDTPAGITFDAQGNLYIADTRNGKIRRVDAVTGIITSIAGDPFDPEIGDGGPATDAFLGVLEALAFDRNGNLLATDSLSHRVRAILAAAPSFQAAPQELSFTLPAGAAPVEQTVQVGGSITGIPFTASSAQPWITAAPDAGNMPAGVRVRVNPAGLAPGNYEGALRLAAPVAQPGTRDVRISMTVTPPGAPSLSAQPASLRFSFVERAAAQTQAVTVGNAGGGSLAFRATSPASWLRVAPSTGTATAAAPVAVNVTADPAGVPPGTYSALITFESASPAQRVNVNVTMTVAAVQQSILIPQSGLTFFAVQGGGPPAPQYFNILNTGSGIMPFAVNSTTLSGGNWLSAFPRNGASDAGSPLVPQIRVDIDPRGLPAGIYYGSVEVAAATAANTPQFVSVILNVLAPGSRIGPIVQPTGLIFVSTRGQPPPGSQTITIQNTDSAALSFRSGRILDGGVNWFTALPADGTVTAAQPGRIVIQPRTDGLAAGVYRGTLTLTFSDGSVRNIAMALVVAPGAAGSTSARTAEGCPPTRLIPVFTQLSTGSTVSAGFPGTVAVKVVDDCGDPMTSGGVIVSFNNGDPPLRLVSLKDGNWAATWVPLRPANNVVAVAEAAIPERNLAGRAQATTELRTAPGIPVVGTGAILNGASYALDGPLAPGGFMTLFGSQLAAQGLAGSVPLPTELGGASIVIAGRESPVYYSSDNQVNAIVPYGIAVNTTHQVRVVRGASISAPQTVTVAPAAPGVFTIDGSGAGQGIVIDAKSGPLVIADAQHPVRAGDTIVIYCTGLGEVNPPVPAGAVAPLTQLSRTVNAVTATIGGVPATVSFAGLSPGSVGLYQVNAVVPGGVAPGDRVELVLTVAGQQSRPVTIAVR